MGQTVKKRNKMNSELKFFLIIAAIILLFIFGLEPIYKLIGKIKTGTLFDEPVNLSPDKPEKPVAEDYTILEPIGASSFSCKLRESTENGDMESTITLYYTGGKLRSIVEENIYSGLTDAYSNYIMSEQNKYKEIKNLNLDNHGMSVEIKLSSAHELSIRGVYLLEKTSIGEIKTAESDTLNLHGNYDEEVYNVAQLYINDGYKCNW